MPAYTIAFDVARLAPTSVQQMTRDFGISAGDDFTLRLRAYGQDGDASPLNLSGATGAVTVWRPGETVAAASVGGSVPSPASAGNMDFYFAPAATSALAGRFLWAARMNIAGESLVVRGSVNIRASVGDISAPVPVPPVEPTTLILAEDGSGIELEDGSGLLVLEG